MVLPLHFGLVFSVCSFALPAHAYVDPGTGLFVFQMLTTTLAGITFMLRKRIRATFRAFFRSFQERQ